MKASSPVKSVFGIRWIVTFAAVALITVVVLSLGAVHERNVRETLTSEIENRILLSARNLALISASALLGNYPELTLHPLLKEMQASRPELAVTTVVDVSGVIQGDTDVRKVGEKYVPPDGLKPLPRVPGQGTDELLVENDELLVARVTVRSSAGQRLGTTSVGIRREYITRTIGRVRFQQIPILISLLAAGIGCAFFLMSFLLRPVAALRSGIERIGNGDFDTPIRLGDRTELGLLAETVNAMASQLKIGQTEARERDRLAHEIELARRIQHSLLPTGRRTFGELVIEGAHQAATEVGGDYYDVIELPGGRVGIAIADVAGKGLAGCMVTSMLHALLHTLSEMYDSPTELLSALDARLGSMLERGRFVSMFYGVLVPETGRIVYASAGHCPLLIYRGATKTVEWQYTEGIPLCAIRGGVVRKTLRDVTVEVGPGDVLVQYTDGINEATDASGSEQFGFEQIERVVQAAGSGGPAAVLDALQQAVESWRGGSSPEDDETLLVIARSEAQVRDRSSEPAGARTAGAQYAEAQNAAAEAARRGLERLVEARQQGRRLVLPATIDSLGLIRGWIGSCPLLEDLPADQLEILHLALYEACANVAEHAYHENPRREYELWWVPPNGPPPASGKPGGEDRGAPHHTVVGEGFFLLRDDGAAYRADNWHESDFSDRAVWRRGRGFGRDIIQRVMDEVAYYPATREGNIVVMTFDPSESLGELRDSETRNSDHERVL